MGKNKKAYITFIVLILCLCLVPAVALCEAYISGDYTYTINGGEAVITKYNGTETEIVLPSAFDGYPVITIGTAFWKQESITKITIPEGVTSISPWAFYNTGITGIALPESLKWLGSEAFLYCTSLTAISVPETNEAFRSVDGVLYTKDMTMLIAYPPARKADSYTIPSKVKTIAESAFNHSSLKEIILPEGIETMGDNAFGSCTKLKRLDLPASLTTVQSSLGFPGCVGGCEALEAIHVSPDNTAYASLDGVLYNKSMTELLTYPLGKAGDSFTAPAGVLSIGKRAFEQNTRLKSVRLPDGMEVIGTDSFAHCVNLEEITLPDSITSIGGAAFWFCQRLNHVTLPKRLTSLGAGAFYACMQLDGIVIPPGVTSIDDMTFDSCRNLLGVTIPPSVTSISETAFTDTQIMVIICEKGSYAQEFARKNKIDHSYLMPKPMAAP